jgi:phosphate transport system substrate-binding protein
MSDLPETKSKFSDKRVVIIAIVAALAIAFISFAFILLNPEEVGEANQAELGMDDGDRSGYGKNFDQLNGEIIWDENMKSTDYQQIVKNSPFKLGAKNPDLYENYYYWDNYENYEQRDYGDDTGRYVQSYGTYPLIDGSTVCVPMATEFAMQHLGMDFETALEFTEYFSTTHYAYMLFIDNSANYEKELSIGDSHIQMDNAQTCNLILGTEPSKEELDYAKSKNVKLYKEPVCLDAFVFIVNKDNPVDSLTAEQIRGIYSGKIKNWSEVGGKDEEILPFQRNANSGSQTGMENIVMNGRKMIPALSHTSYSTMGGLVEGVAEYDNGKASIGYSYKYFVDTIYKNDNVKIISVDGTAPSAENVRSGKYPFSTYYYGVIRDEDRAKTGGKFLDWILSEEGQKCVKQAGYITLK